MLALSSGAMVTLAGCDGGGEGSPTGTDSPTSGTDNGTDDGSTTDSETATDEPLGAATDPILNIVGQDVPTDINMSPFGDGRNGAMNSILNSPAGSPLMPSVQRDDVEYSPHLLVESYVNEERTHWIQKYDTDFTWHNGKKVKARDRYNTLKIGQIGANIKGSQLQYPELEIVDEATLKHKLSSPTREQIWLGQFGSRVPQNPRWITKPKLEEYQDATTAEELNSIDQKYETEEKINLSDATGHGMFQVSSVSSDSATFTKYQDHPYADDQNIQQIQYSLVGGDSAKRQQIQNGNVDLFKGTPTNTTIPNSHEKFRKRNPGLNKYDFNWHGPCSDMHLRRALTYVISSEDIVQNRGRYYPVETWSGMSPEADEVFLGSEFADKLIDYGSGSKKSKAEEEMNKAGYEKQNGNWVDEDGNALELTVMSLSWWDNPQQTVVSQLKSFGIKVDNQTVNWGPWDSARKEPANNDWDMMQFFHGMNYPHPARYFEHDWLGGYRVYNSWSGDWGYANKPRMVKMPSEVGAKKIGSTSKSLNLWDAMQSMANPNTADAEVDRLVKRMCQWMNYAAAIVPVFQGDARQHYNKNTFVSEGFDDPEVLNSYHAGTIRGVEK